MAGDPETIQFSSGSTWESVIWPRWLPIQGRLPLIAQLTAAVALLAAVMMPRWSEVSAVSDPVSSAAPSRPATATPAPLPGPEKPIPVATSRPAHLNLDVRHNFRSVHVSVSVDGKSALETKLEGSGRRFGVVGKRAERGFTRTLDVAPGARVVRIWVRSTEDQFDQTRVERFDLDSASVASLRIAADRSGLSVVADRPALRPAAVAEAVPAAPAALVPQAQLTKAAQAAEAALSAQQAGAIAEVYQSLRSSLIAMAGFIASAATGFLVESFMRTRRALQFPASPQPALAVSNAGERRRRRREQKPPQTPAVTSQ